MRRLTALIAAALALGACSTEEPAMPVQCLDDGVYARALAGAPGSVRLPGGVAISTCVREARDNAQLHELGLRMTGVAEDLATRARDERDAVAATRLGFLAGAVRRGAQASGGIQAELARRIERTAYKLERSGPELQRALADGVRAGEARG